MRRSSKKPQKPIPFEDTSGISVTIPDEEESSEGADPDSLDNEPTDEDLQAHAVVW